MAGHEPTGLGLASLDAELSSFLRETVFAKKASDNGWDNTVLFLLSDHGLGHSNNGYIQTEGKF